jgi:hypothetical protein
VDLFIKVAAVFGFGDPVPGIGPDEQAAGDLHALQGTPVLEGIAEGHAIVAFADAEEHGRLPLGCVGEGTLLPPDGIAFLGRAAIGHFASVDTVADAPLSGQVHFTGVTDDALVARGGGFEPVGEMAPITGARCAHSGAIDVGVALEGFVDRLVDFIAGCPERIELDGLGKFLAETGRAGVVGH